MSRPTSESIGGRMSNEFRFMSATRMLELIRSKQISPVEVVNKTLADIEATQDSLNAFVTVAPESSLDAARDVERAVMAGENNGLLTGLPISIKDLIAVKDMRFTSGSCTQADFISPVDSPCSERIKANEGVLVGKTTTTEFGCKPSSTSPLTGVTRNPWDLSRTAGGSSSGAAASVAAGITPFALGTDGGGSIRIPSSLCGVFGFKPTFGRVPVYPVSATPTLAHVGPITRTVHDAALMLTAISGYDKRDPGSISSPVPSYLEACNRPPKGLRIAWSPTLGYAKPTREVIEVAEASALAFEDLNCSVELVEKVFDDPFDLWEAEFYAGVGTRLETTLRDRREIIDPAVANMLDYALDQRIEQYYRSVFSRYTFREYVQRFFDDYDLLITPTIPVAAFDAEDDMPRGFNDASIVSWVAYTYPFNLCGLPAASLPCGFTSDGLPVGLQIVGGSFSETDILSAASAFESARPWAHIKPSI